MSAIWGCVDMGGGTLPPGLCGEMRKPFLDYKIDRYASRSDGNACMGCAHQYIHWESPEDPLPVWDGSAGIMLTADAHIYNRDALIGGLCAGRDDMPDGELLFLAYGKWGRDFPMHVYGSYAYAVYDKRRGELVVGADHTSTRSIYYRRHGSKVYFSTLAEAVINGMGEDPGLNAEWAALFLAMTTYSILTNPTDTPYKNIFRVTAAHYIVFTADGESSVEYWSPGDVRPLRLGSDGEYRERFRALMEKCTREALRTSGETAIMLSGGMDSGSVAAFAAPLLNGQGKILHSYTHVPVDSFERPPGSLCDESGIVLRLAEMYPNIRPRFLSTPDRNGILSLGDIMHYDLFPVKSTTNIAWIDALKEAAANDGCRLMLTGQYGNTTISLGSIDACLLTYLSRGRLLKCWSLMGTLSKKMRYSRKRILKYLCSQLAPAAFKRAAAGDYLKGSMLNRDFALKAGVRKKDRRLEDSLRISPAPTFKEQRRHIYDNIVFAHICDGDTKVCLRHGVRTVDVTRDIRIIEFCLSLPMECFVAPVPETRRLCRIYLSDLLPGEILAEGSPRGRQSADMLERLAPRWDEAYRELRRVCLSPHILEIADEKKLRDALVQLESMPGPDKSALLKQVISVYSLGLFMEKRRWKDDQPPLH